LNKLIEMETFVQVVDAGSLATAASRLRRNPSSVSKIISSLEDRLGVLLLKRTTRNLLLTDVGSDFFEHCKAILTHINEVEKAAASRDTEPRGLLRIIGLNACSPSIILPLISGFVTDYPNIRIDLSQAEFGKELIYEDMDVALRIGEITLKSLECVKLAPSRLLICASPEYLATYGSPQSLVNLADHNCIGFNTKSRFNPWELCHNTQTEKIQLSGRFIANNAELIRQAALSGWGICQLSSFIIGSDIQEGRLVELFPKQQKTITNHVCAIFPRKKRTPYKTQAFVKYLKEELLKGQHR